MQLSMSNFSRGSSRRNRTTSGTSAASTTANGSMASSFLERMRSPNFDSSAAVISSAFIDFLLLPSPPRGEGRIASGLGRRRLLLVALGELVGLLQRAQLIGQQRVAGAGRDRHLDRFALGQRVHAAHLVLDAHE